MNTPRLTKADCIWAAKQPHPIFAVRKLWPKSKRFPSSRYPSLRRAFRHYGVYYPWPERLPRGWGCVQRFMGQPVHESPRRHWSSVIRATKERKSIGGKPIPRKEMDRYIGPKEIYLMALREAVMPQYWGTCSILEGK